MTLCAALWTAACGYLPLRRDRLLGRSTVAVGAFGEGEPVGIAPDLTRHLAELISQGGTQLALSPESAEAALSGRIRSSRTNAMPIADPRPGAPISGYQVSIDVEAKLVARDGEVLWSGAMSFTEDFVPTVAAGETSPVATLETESARRRALDRLARTAAREIYERIVMSGS